MVCEPEPSRLMAKRLFSKEKFSESFSRTVPVKAPAMPKVAPGGSFLPGRMRHHQSFSSPEAAGRRLREGWGIRGLAWWNGKIYVGTQDGRLIAIEQIDGYEQTLVYGDQGTVKNVLLSVTDNFGQQLQFA